MPLVLDGTNGVSGVDGTASNPAIEGTDSNTGIFYPAADTVAIGTGGTERLRVDSAGNAGLGVTPSAWNSSIKALQGVGGWGAFYSDAGYYGATGLVKNSVWTSVSGTSWNYVNTQPALRYEMGGSAGLGTHAWYNAPSGTAGNTITFTQAMTLDASGNLGIGTTNPLFKLVVSKAGAEGIEFVPGGTSNVSTTQYYNRSGAVYTANAQDASFHSWLISGTERARITSGGEFLVGTTSTSFGTQGARMMTTGQIQGVSDSGSDSFAGYRQTTTAANTIYTGYSNVGSTQALKFTVQADGNVRIAAGATYGNLSDKKLKTNIVDATPKLQDVLQLQVKNFGIPSNDIEKAIGFIAQEFEEVFPSLVIESADKDFEGNDLGTTTKAIKESALIPILVKAMQELNAKVEAQAVEIAALKAQP